MADDVAHVMSAGQGAPALLPAAPLRGGAQRLLLAPAAQAQLYAGPLAGATVALVARSGAGVLAAVQGAAAGLAAGPQLVEATPGGGGRVATVAGCRDHLGKGVLFKNIKVQ